MAAQLITKFTGPMLSKASWRPSPVTQSACKRMYSHSCDLEFGQIRYKPLWCIWYGEWIPTSASKALEMQVEFTGSMSIVACQCQSEKSDCYHHGSPQQYSGGHAHNTQDIKSFKWWKNAFTARLGAKDIFNLITACDFLFSEAD